MIVVTPTSVESMRPAPGALMAGPKGGAIYRIQEVTLLRQAGDDRKHRYRLECRPVCPGDIPPDAEILPYRLTAVARRGRVASAAGLPPPVTSPLLLRMGIRDRWALERIQAKSPLLFALGLEPIGRTKADTERARLARVARIRRDEGLVVGLKDLRGEGGLLLREADIESDVDARDPEHPTRRIVRNRRADPLHTLLKHKSITLRHYDAAEALRSDIEDGVPHTAAAWTSEVHSAPWGKSSITDRQVHAIGMVRDALEAVSRRDRPVLAWMMAGGTISGFTRFARCHQQTAVGGLRNALGAVADIYFGGGR